MSKELIKIEKKEGKETCNARELHSFLESKYRFSDWIKSRIDKYSFTEGEDFFKVSEKIDTSGGLQNATSYFISIDMAKELSMVENNGRGREARQYFIACENNLKNRTAIPDFNNPAIAARAWADEYENRQIAENMVKEKTEFIDDLIKERLFTVKQMADYFSFQDLGQNKLFKLLRDRKILTEYNTPYRNHIEAGHCSIRAIKRGDKSFDQAVFTAKGFEYVKKGLIKLGYKQENKIIGE